ncbi:MAG: Subtilisin [Parcubacteria group bacterium GW2011_GWA2_44_13]|nr:MAG: Subtilisin [Parcubacteria group bacterium GW2011_GWA2_44_13]
MASPHVAGAVALVLATAVQSAYDVDVDGAWDPAEVRAALQAAADDLGTAGHDNFYGYGLVDAEENVTGIQTNP